MTRYDDSQRSGRLAVTFGDLRVVDRVVASIASSPRLGSDGTVMTRHDSQRSGRLAVTFGEFRVVDRVAASTGSLPRLGFDGSVMKRHDDSQRIDGLAVTQRDERVGSRLTRIWAGLYTRPRMGTDSIQPSRRLPTTDYRLPTTDYRASSRPRGAGVERGTIDPCGAPAPRIRAFHGRVHRPPLPPVHLNMRSHVSDRHPAWCSAACPAERRQGMKSPYD